MAGAVSGMDLCAELRSVSAAATTTHQSPGLSERRRPLFLHGLAFMEVAGSEQLSARAAIYFTAL